ncbi:MAG: hypothetical protein L6V90_11295 [Treponema succinifaciens]|nr:MAG: hypothetical protein L6V90_11295 [Treponema succinifaciens]
MFTEIEDSRITNCYNASPIIITTSDTDYMNYNYTTTTRALGDLRSARAGGIAMQMMYTHITGCMNAGEVTVPYANFGYGNSLAGGIVGKLYALASSSFTVCLQKRQAP